MPKNSAKCRTRPPRFNDEDIKAVMSAGGNEVWIDVLRELDMIRRVLGLSRNRIYEIGDRLDQLLHRLMNGNLRNNNPDEFSELCNLLSSISALDFQALKQFWNLRYTPHQIEQALFLWDRARKGRRESGTDRKSPRNYFLAAVNINWISKYRVPEIPCSR